MEKNKLIIVLVAIAVTLSVSSCDQISPHLDVLQGNYNFSRGEYQEAMVSYLSVREYPEYNQWIDYNLGNVFHALGEGEAALEVWESGLDSTYPDLLFGVHYNRGVVYYELGQYRKAYQSFKDAVILNPGSLEAKINLELTIQRLSVQSGNTRLGNADNSEDRNTSQDSERILEYVRKKEGEPWFVGGNSEDFSNQRDW